MYSKYDFINAVRSVDIKSGDLVMIHCGFDRLGTLMQGVKSSDELSNSIMSAMLEIIEDGTMVVPTFSYSFGNGEIFDPKTTPCPLMGQFSEYFWRQDNVYRSCDPFLSVAAIGPLAKNLTEIHTNTSFGKNSFFDRFTDMGGKILCIGVELRWATILHSYEEDFGVPHRYKKFFIGKINDNGNIRKISWIYNVRPLCSNAYPTFRKMMESCKKSGLVKTAPLGNGFISSIKAQTYKEFALKSFVMDPWITAAGPKCDLIQSEKDRTGSENYEIKLQDTKILNLASSLCALPRDLVSDGYDAALSALKSIYPEIQIYSFPSGYKAFSWIVPERWICKEAAIYKLNGELIFSSKQNPLHAMRYSLAIDDEIDHKQLLDHLHTLDNCNNAIPYISEPYERDWGLCCSKSQKQNLKEDKYKVKIDSAFSYGELKVAEITIPGKSDECILLCANLSSPYQFNNGLSGVIAGLKIIENLHKINLYYSYKLIIVPANIGSACYLNRFIDNIDKFRGGIFLDALANQHPLNFISSHANDSYFDSIIQYISICKGINILDFNTFPNDSCMFNSLGINMVYLSRKNKNLSYLHYNTDLDTLENANLSYLENSIDFVLEIIYINENDVKFKKLFAGELFIKSVDGLDHKKDKKIIHALTFGHDEMLSKIAIKNKCDFKELLRVAKILETARLAHLERK